MELFHNIILIILSIILVTSTAAPLWEDEDFENNGEFGDYFEGDMLLTKSQREAITEASDPDSRNGLRDVAKRWPNRTVVYYIEEDDFDEEHVQKIEDALADIANKSCITFRRRDQEEEHAVLIQCPDESAPGFFTDNSSGEIKTTPFREFGDYFEGDMLLTKSQREAITEASDPDSRNGLRDVAKRWPNRTVVYYIEEDDFDEEHVQKIEDALADIANKSCITFRRRDQEEEHAVLIQGNKSGCYSNVGFSITDDEGAVRQVLNLAKGCFKHGTVVHEMLHTLGFYHMQSTYDRDDFVTIVWENIKPGHEHNFAKYSNDTVTDFGVSYDYESVMHYPKKAFSVNGNQTIIPTKENVTIGQRNGLSESDILKLNKMYCEETDDKELIDNNNGDQVAVIDK